MRHLPRRGRRRPIRSAVRAASGICIASLALVGCGGHPATRADVIARGNAICANASRALANLPPASDGATGTTVDFVKAAPVVTHEATALNALPRPAAGRRLLERFLAAESALAAGYRHLAAVQRAGGSAAQRRGLEVLTRSDAASLARQYGLGQCGAATPTVR